MIKRLLGVAVATSIAVVAALTLGIGSAHATAFTCSVQDFSAQGPVVTANSVTIPAAEETCNQAYFMSFHLEYEANGTWFVAGDEWCYNKAGAHDFGPTTCTSVPNEFDASSHHVVSVTGNRGDPELSNAPIDSFCGYRWRANTLWGHHLVNNTDFQYGPSGPSVFTPAGSC